MKVPAIERLIKVVRSNHEVAALYHQQVRGDWVIQQEGTQRQEVKLHGVAMTVSGRELAQAIPQVAMPAYIRQLKKFLSDRFKVEMVRIN